MRQHTIKKPVTIKGVGLHTGKPVTMTFRPAKANHGYKFQRIDLEGQPVISADVSKVVSTNRGTTIRNGEAQVSTIEHALSALSGLGVDNALIELDGPEMPIMDGSAIAFVEGIESVGLEELDAEREYLHITAPISYKDETTGAELLVLPADNFQVTTLIDFDSEVLGHQYASLENIADYKAEIASCRTFVFLHELEQLLNQDLIKGGDLDNAIVIVDRPVNQEKLDELARRLNKPSIKVAQQGILNTVKLRFENEPARHKLLDIIGDLSLVGKPIKGRVVATKPGHKANIAFANILKQQWREQRKLKGKPIYNPDLPPVYDVMELAAMLPHRYPFLLVDKIIELTDTYVVGVKNVTFNEQYFQGHFPGNPVMPGVLQIEAMAQTGGILALSNKEEPATWDTYFLKIENAKFKHKIVPGDTVIFKLELAGPIRRGICQMHGTAYVGNKIVSEAEMVAQIVKRT